MPDHTSRTTRNGLPAIPTTTYNVWDEVEASTETFVSTTRTKTQTYDNAGRALTSETTSSPTTGVSLPKVTNTYNTESGGLETQSATIEGATKTITAKHNTLGQFTEYTDADGNVTKYSYEEGSDERLVEVNEGKGEEATSKQTYSYDPTTGLMTKLIDSAAGTFSATYDIEGKILTENYPNGMTANYAHDPAGSTTGIEYVKNTGCASKCPETWFSDTTVASIYGETLQHYDPSGRTRKAETTIKGKLETTTISHYAGPGEALTWTSEGASKWTRNIPGIDGTLSAIQTSSGTTTLQLHDLQGDIVGTASLSESETKLLTTYNSTEFGVPTTSTPPKYSWLGAGGITSELTSSGVSTQGGSSYVPEIGRPLQTGPIATPGDFANGTGGAGIVQATYLQAAASQMKTIAIEHEAALEAAARLEAEERAAMEACPASMCHIDGPGEGNCEVNCVTEEEPSEEEWRSAEKAFYGPGARAASVLGEFKHLVKSIAHEASVGAEYLYNNSLINVDKKLKEAKKQWHFMVKLFNFAELGFHCSKGAKDWVDEADEVLQAFPPSPAGKVVVGVSAVLGCIEGVAGG